MNDLWSRMRPARKHLDSLLAADNLIGFKLVKDYIQERLSASDTASLLLLHGPRWCGKTAVTRWIRATAPTQTVLVDDTLNCMVGLDRNGHDVARLINALRSAVSAAGKHAVLVFDDVDHHLLPPGIAEFVRAALRGLDIGDVVLTSSTPVGAVDRFLPPKRMSLERRHADVDDFSAYLKSALTACAVEPVMLSDDLRLGLFELSEQTSDFQAVQYAVEMLIAYAANQRRPAEIGHLHDLLDSDKELRSHYIPAFGTTASGRLAFRRKDKTELLADLLMRHYSNGSELRSTAASRLTGLDQSALRDGDRLSFHDIAMIICLTNSPRDLVDNLLGPTQIAEELEKLNLDPHELRGHGQHAERVSLLIRGIGFTLIDTPRGLGACRSTVSEALDLLEDPDVRADVAKGTTLNAAQQIEAVLNDLVHFWSTLMFGSVRQVVQSFNQSRPERRLEVARLSNGELVALLRHLTECADEESQRFRLRTLHVDRPVSDALLQACDVFVMHRNRFAHLPQPTASSAERASTALRDRCLKLSRAADDVLRLAGEGAYPSVIKLSEITVDEYSRRIYRGVDADRQEIRFAMTDEAADSLAVATHYYLLPNRRVSVNPYVCPRSGVASTVLFDRAEAYDKASETQWQQAQPLLDRIEGPASACVLDVGCGTGRFTLQLAALFETGRIHGIDNSPDMIEKSLSRAAAEGLAQVTFEVADLFEYEPDLQFDVVLSTSTMHWLAEPERAYAHLVRLLRRGGQLVVHQGGRGNYEELWQAAYSIIEGSGLMDYLQGWVPPLYYPTPEGLEELLKRLDLTDVRVESDHPPAADRLRLIRDFSEATLLAFLGRLPEARRDTIRKQFLDEAAELAPEISVHRLYATARRR